MSGTHSICQFKGNQHVKNKNSSSFQLYKTNCRFDQNVATTKVAVVMANMGPFRRRGEKGICIFC